ncbi:diguanylate cyclase [Delftia sp. PS-11]|uniref:diguanylate cyclase n=1 Tax=Delftia sp. PS-11 TaxID=2767222 RepID=UPI0024568842|nr:diguanylate cyclase [Delftia sp. PS-11]KAJ8740919.1 diguanylate cyclase [Delftia sp. PS-11]
MREMQEFSKVQRALLALVFMSIFVTAWLTANSLVDLVRSQRVLDEAHRTVHMADTLLRQVIDAETGQRGYLLAGTSDYLAPYHAAIAEIRQTRRNLERMVEGPKEIEALKNLLTTVDTKLEELAQTIQLRIAGDNIQADSVLRSGDGRKLMEHIREMAFHFSTLQEQRVQLLQEDHSEAIYSTYLTMGLALLSNISLLILLVVRSLVFARKAKINEKEMQARNTKLMQLAQKTTEHNQHMQRLSELGRFLQSCGDSAEAHALLAERLPELLKSDTGAFYAMASSRNQLQLSFSWGNEVYVEFFEPHECWALRSGLPFVQPQGTGVSTCHHLQLPQPVSRPGTQCLPIASHGELTGLVIMHPSPEESGTSDAFIARLRQTTIEQVALSLGNLKLRDSLKQQSIRDPLTGLYNRRFLDESLHREILRSERRGYDHEESALAVLMVDVDHFKRFNDQHGHDMGDHVLRNVAQTLMQTVRCSDLVARFGGEEFTVVLPSTCTDIALERAEALRAAVEAMPPSRVGGELHAPVTISIGLAVLPEGGTTADALLQNADTALYGAKRAGRNKVKLFGAADGT